MTPEITCSACRERLLEYAANVLAERHRHAVSAHLTSCADCRSELAGWQTIRAAARADEQSIPLDNGAVASWDAIRIQLSPRPLLSSRGVRTERHDIEGATLDISTSRGAGPGESNVSRRRPFVAVAAFLLVVTLAVAVFSMIGASGGAHKKSIGVSPTVAAPNCLTNQLKAETPPYSSIRGISMVSATDGWAVGYIWNQQSSTPPATLIMRFHNCAWEPFGESMTSARLESVSMTSADDGWAVGETVGYTSTADANPPPAVPSYEVLPGQSFVLHYTRGQWQQTKTPGSDIPAVSTEARMTSSQDGWMLVDGGNSHLDPQIIAEQETVLHYTDGAWTVVPTPFKTPGMTFWDLASVTAGECWIAGYDTNMGVSLVAHYQNGQWQTWNPAPSSDNYAQLTSIGVVSAQDVWAASPYEMFHFDGSTWKQVQLPTAPRQASSGAFPDLVMRSASDGWMVASSAAIVNNKVTGPLALHYDGAQWQWVTIPAPDMDGLHAMRYVSTTQAWAAGDGLSTTSGDPVARAKFLYLDNGTWTEIPG